MTSLSTLFNAIGYKSLQLGTDNIMSAAIVANHYGTLALRLFC